MLKAIIFDVDGTIAETEEYHRVSFNQLFAEEGLDWHWSEDDYRGLLRITGGKERMRHYISERSDLDLNEFPEDRLLAMHKRKSTLYRVGLENNPPQARPGIKRLVDNAIENGIILALATTTGRSNADALLLDLFSPAIFEKFSVRICGEDVDVKKPDPEVYLKALAGVGVKPEEAIALEDSSAGLKSARNAGMQCVVTPAQYTSHHTFDGALAVVSHLGERLDPYQHIMGEGRGDNFVTCDTIAKWMAS
ncbi:MAG: HAD-IA family hydrolase [Rhizobiaceae bacterium]